MPKLLGKAVTGQTADVALTGGAETVVMTSARVPVRVATCLVHIRAWGQWTLGGGANGYRGRIYRGTAAVGSVVGEVNPVVVNSAEGSTETGMVEAVASRRDVAGVEYSLSIEQVSACGNGSFLQGAMEVEVLSG